MTRKKSYVVSIYENGLTENSHRYTWYTKHRTVRKSDANLGQNFGLLSKLYEYGGVHIISLFVSVVNKFLSMCLFLEFLYEPSWTISDEKCDFHFLIKTQVHCQEKHTPCKLSFVFTSQLNLTVRTTKIRIISDAVYVSYFKL